MSPRTLRIESMGSTSTLNDDELSICTFDEKRDDGWVRGVHGELFLWVPPYLRPTLAAPPCIAFLNWEFSTALNFTGSAHGEQWIECFDTSKEETSASSPVGAPTVSELPEIKKIPGALDPGYEIGVPETLAIIAILIFAIGLRALLGRC